MISALLLLACMQGPVVINEFSYDDSGTDDREYVELYNRTGNAVDISGWRLESEDSNGLVNRYTVKPSTSVKPSGFFVIGASTVPNVNLVVGSQNLWGNSNNALVLRDSKGAIQDTLLYEANKGVWASARTKGLIRGDGVWGNFTSVDLFETSWQRIRDGADFRSTRIFHLLPSTPGKTNNLKSRIGYSENFDALKVGTDLPLWGGSFRMPKIIDPTLADSNNTNAIKKSPQGGNACIFWDNAGGGNANMLLTDWVRSIQVEAWVYFDAKLENAARYETWSLGVQGSTGTFYNSPNLGNGVGGTANGNTGVTATFQVTDKVARLYLIDHNDGGWGKTAKTDAKILGSIDLTAGKNDGWKRLRLTVVGNRAELVFGGTYGCGDGQHIYGTISQPAFGGIYVGYREFISVNPTARPFTCDAFRVTVPTAGLGVFGTATKTTKGTPVIGSNGLPSLGYTGFRITGSGLVPNSASIYVLGAQQVSIDLGAVGGQRGSKLLVLPLTLGGAANSAKGESSILVPLPCDTKLTGVNLLWQILDLDPSLPVALKLGNSGGLSTTLGQ